MSPAVTALRARHLLSMDSTIGAVIDAQVTVADGRIVYAGPRATAPPLPAHVRLVDLPHHILLPGLVNAHTHLPMTLLRGLADDLPLQKWLEEHIFPAERRLMSPERVRAGASLAAAELLLSGTTCCGDGYFLENHVLEAAAAVGLRGVFAQGVIDFPAPGIADAERRFEVLRHFLASCTEGGLQRRAVFAHSPYTCSAATLQRAKRLAAHAGCRFFIHVAETDAERTSSLAAHDGLSPVAYLEDLGVLDRETTLIHAVHVDNRDIDLIAARGCAIVVNTESNMKLASGVASLPLFLANGIPVGLGTDGAASNNDLDLLGEIGMTARLHKLVSGDPTTLSAEQILRVATAGGAHALGLGALTGSIRPGKAADLIALRTDRPHAQPLHDPISHVVYAASAADVDLVMVDGRLIIGDGRPMAFEPAALMQQVRQCLATADHFSG